MKIKIAALIFIGSTLLTRADQLVQSVQQALKDQGFYYGEVTGETNANLTAAIRRYQIRNGLQVSGELNSETLQSLGINSSASVRPATKSASPGTGEPAKPSEPAGWTWQRSRRCSYWRGRVRRSSIHHGSMDIHGQTNRSAVSGFRSNVARASGLPRRARRVRYSLSKCTDCSSAQTVPTKIWASMRTRSRSASSDTQIVARRNFRCGSNSKCLPIRFSCKSSLIAL